MNCLRDKAPMYRVVNPKDQSAKAICTRCCQYTECAECSKCKDTKCLGCYNKEVTSFGQPREIAPELTASDDMGL